MTRCPVCDDKLRESLPNIPHCETCGYSDRDNIHSKKDYLYRMADRLDSLKKEIRNINTDEELEEIEEEIEDCLHFIAELLRLEREKSSSLWDDVNTTSTKGTFTKGSGSGSATYTGEEKIKDLLRGFLKDD